MKTTQPSLKQNPRCLAALFAFILSVLAGCVSSPATDSLVRNPASVPLTNTYWQLVRVASVAVPDTGDQQRPHIMFLDDGRVRGFSGCNQYLGDYQLKGENLIFDSLGSTRRACENNRIEPLLFAAFARTLGVNLDGARLRLLGENAEALAEFEAVNRR